MIGVCFSGVFFCTGGFCGRAECAGSFCFSSYPVRIWFWCVSATRISRLTSRFSLVSAAISRMIFVCSAISAWISRGVAGPVSACGRVCGRFFANSLRRFQILLILSRPFFVSGKTLRVLLVKFVTVPALEDEVDLRFLDYLVFAALRFLHNYTFISLPCGKKELWFYQCRGSPE